MISTPLSSSPTQEEYIQHIYDTGEISNNRPIFDDLLGKHVANLEKWIRGAPNQSLVIIQARMRAVPVLFALLNKQKSEEDSSRFSVGEDGKRILRLYSISDMYKLPDPDYLIAPIFESVAVSMMYGMSGTGKSFMALHIGLCVAHGLYWMGHRVKQGVVWYVNTEGGRGLKKRLAAWYKEYPELTPTPAFQIIPWSLDLRENTQDVLNTLECMSVEEKPQLLIFDNFSMCAAGINQNKQEEVTPILKILNDLAQEKECHVMILHHTNKEDDVNGTMAFRNHVDHMVELRREDKNDRQSPILFCSKKTRDDEPFRDIKTELKQISLDTHPDTLEPITSCVIIASEQALRSDGLKDMAQNVLDILGDRSLLFSDWQKECLDILKISKATFERYRAELSKKKYTEKYIPDGHRIYHYRKVQQQ